MPTPGHTVVGRAGQHFLDMAEPERLSGAIDRRQQLARQFGDVGHIGAMPAIVAIAASLGRGFAEMPQQHGAATARGFDQAGERVEPRSFARQAAFLDLAQPRPGTGEILRAPQHQRHRRIAVAPGAAGFLIVAFDRFGQAGMGDKAHVGFVDAHAEGDRGHHHHVFGGDERGLVGGAHLGRKPCVIRQHGACRCRKLRGQPFHPGAGRGIDNARPGMLFDQAGKLPQRIVARGDRVGNVGPVEPGDDQPVVGNAELGEDIGTGVGIGGGGQRQARRIAKMIEQRAQQAIIGAEIMPPFRHAMRLVDGEQRDRHGFEQFAKMGLAGTFRRHVKQVERAIAEPFDGRAAIGVGAGQRGGANPVGAGRAQLVVHQRDQRRHHHTGSAQHRRRQLIGQRLARAGRHHRQARSPREHAIDDFVLHPAKRGKTEHPRQRGAGIVQRGAKRRIEQGHAPRYARLRAIRKRPDG